MSSDTGGVGTHVLSYGRRPRPGRRWARWAAVVAIVATVACLANAVVPRVRTWYARRAAIRQVQAWYAQARTCQIPAGTLLYSENPADFPHGQLRLTTRGGRRRTFVVFDGSHPALRRVGYTAGGVPTVYGFDVLFVHERRMWDASGGTRPVVVSVSYFGTDPQGRPEFDTLSFGIGSGEPPYPSCGAATVVHSPPGRSLTNLRIYAGTVDATDATRFTLPFQCDGGRGRFEFRMDDDVSDGGKLAPDVWIEWDGPAPTTRARDGR